MKNISVPENKDISTETTFELFASAYLEAPWFEPGAARRELRRRGFIGPIWLLLHVFVFFPAFFWNFAAWHEWLPGAFSPRIFAGGWCLTLIAAGGLSLAFLVCMQLVGHEVMSYGLVPGCALLIGVGGVFVLLKTAPK